eukprot:m.124508 g.124508  ORF g.124508 m.124508 type:complete len:167 (-) comp17294_c0_seq2:418-918(-)
MEGGKFRYFVFDPPLILLQIVAVQAWYYAVLGSILFLIGTSEEVPLSVDLLFDDSSLKALPVKMSYLIASPIAGGLLGCIVGRAKQCLDFAATIHVVHLFGTLLYAGVPKTLNWWIINCVCIGITAATGEYICMNVDLGAIRVGSKSSPSVESSKKLKYRQSDANE